MSLRNPNLRRPATEPSLLRWIAAGAMAAIRIAHPAFAFSLAGDDNWLSDTNLAGNASDNIGGRGANPKDELSPRDELV
jgi:hypothetical protein